MIALELLACCVVSAQPLTRPRQPESQKPQATNANQYNAQPPINVTVNVPEKRPEDTDKERAQTADQIAIQQSIARYTKLLVVVGFLDVLAIGFGLFYTGKAANAAKKSAEIADESLRLAHRPYFDVRDLVVTEHVIVPELTISYKVFNASKNPGTIRNVATSYSIRHSQITVTREWPETRVLISPGRGYPAPIPVTASTEQERAAIAQNEMLIDVEYRLTYEDAFRVKHPQTIRRTVRRTSGRYESILKGLTKADDEEQGESAHKAPH